MTNLLENGEDEVRNNSILLERIYKPRVLPPSPINKNFLNFEITERALSNSTDIFVSFLDDWNFLK